MNDQFLGIDHVMVTVGDLEVARKFYEEVLGLEEMDCPVKDGQRIWYRIGGQQLHVNLQEKYHKAGFGHFAIAIKLKSITNMPTSLASVVTNSQQHRSNILMASTGYSWTISIRTQ